MCDLSDPDSILQSENKLYSPLTFEKIGLLYRHHQEVLNHISNKQASIR